MELQPANPEFVDTLVLACQSIREVAKAQTVLESGLKLYPEFPEFLDGKYSLARLYDRTGATSRAVCLYEEILQHSEATPGLKIFVSDFLNWKIEDLSDIAHLT